MAEKEEQRTANRPLTKKRVPCLNEGLSFVSRKELVESLVLRNLLFRQTPNLYRLA